MPKPSGERGDGLVMPDCWRESVERGGSGTAWFGIASFTGNAGIGLFGVHKPST